MHVSQIGDPGTRWPCRARTPEIRFRKRHALLFASRIPLPLCRFGLMEWREMQDMHDAWRWRKAALFDRLMSFDVRHADRWSGGH